MPSQEPSATFKLVCGYLCMLRFKMHHLHFTYQSEQACSGNYICSKEANSDSYTGASTEWQKTQLLGPVLGQNTSFLLDRSVAIKMLFPSSIYCSWPCVAARNEEQRITNTEKLANVLVFSVQLIKCILNFLARNHSRCVLGFFSSEQISTIFC